MDKEIIYKVSKDPDDVGCILPSSKNESVPIHENESQDLKVALRDAQNANRGGKTKGELKREPLHQVNIKCPADLAMRFVKLTELAGKTQRSLLEESVYYLECKYKKR